MLRSVTVSAVVVMAAALMPAASGHAATYSSHKKTPAIGDKCLVGTWLDKKNTESVIVKHNLVTMTGKGGDIDHIHASGVDHDNWANSRPLYGTIGEDQVKEVIRGINTVRFQPGAPGGLQETEVGWSADNTNTLTYQGHTTNKKNSNTGQDGVFYKCSAKKLTWLSGASTVVGHETRLSRKP
jgi:hypothetical protein